MQNVCNFVPDYKVSSHSDDELGKNAHLMFK